MEGKYEKYGANKMIKLIIEEDIKDLFSVWDKINERTKKHTLDIKALEKRVKELELKIFNIKLQGGKTNGNNN